MSIQSAIDYNVTTKAGRYLHSFVISGESGDANVPANVHIRFYGCSIGTLTLPGRNGIFIEGGTCASVNSVASRVAGRGVTFSGDALLSAMSDADLYACILSGSWKLSTKSFLRADAGKFSGSDIGIDLKTGSSTRATRCTFAGHGTAAVKADSGSYALLSKCPSVQASTAALWAGDRAVIEAIECALVEGTGTDGLLAELSGRIELQNCKTVKGATRAGNARTKGFIALHKCDTIEGSGGPAVLLDSSARADIRSFKSLKGLGDSAIKCLADNYVYVGDGLLLQSAAKDAVEALGASTVEVASVLAVKGQGRHGASAAGASKVTFLAVQSLVGAAGDGVSLDGASEASLGDVDTLTGQAGNGITAVGGSKVDAHSVKAILGQAGHGLVLAGGSKAVVKNSDSLVGQAGHGASLAGASELVIHGTPSIEGTAGDGVHLEGGSVVRAGRCDSILGASGDGISMVGGGKIHVSDCQNISGASGAGIRAVGTSPGQDRVFVDNCIVVGAAVGLDVTQVKVKSHGSTYTGPQSLVADQAHIVTSEDLFSGDASLSQTVYEESNTTIDGDLAVDDVTIFTVKGNVTGTVSGTSAGVLSVKSVAHAMSLTDSGLVGAKAEPGTVTLAGGGVVLAGGSAEVQGVGAALMANAGIPELTVNYVSASDAAVDVNSPAQVLVTAPNFRVNGE
jgi:hypothetical protein